jgi:hypothetical protein
MTAAVENRRSVRKTDAAGRGDITDILMNWGVASADSPVIVANSPQRFKGVQVLSDLVIERLSE